MSNPNVTNVIVAGVGGQGVLKASDILGEAIFRRGFDVKKAEVHGMSQRGGSVKTDVRYGEKVYSPMVPIGECDYLVVLSADQVEINRPSLKAGGVLIAPDAVDENRLTNKRSLNVALLGVLSRHLDIPEADWREAIRVNLPEKIQAVNFEAFALGRNS